MITTLSLVAAMLWVACGGAALLRRPRGIFRRMETVAGVPALIHLLCVMHATALLWTAGRGIPPDPWVCGIGVMNLLAMVGLAAALVRSGGGAESRAGVTTARISELERALAKAEAERDRTAALVESLSDRYLILSPDLICREAEPGAAALVGRASDHLVGSSLPEIFSSPDLPKLEKHCLEAMKTGTPMCCEILQVSAEKWLECRLFPHRLGITLFLTDICERKETEKTLRTAKEQLEIAVGASNIGFWDWCLKDHTVVFSPEWKSQIGYERHEIADDFTEWENRIHPDDLAGVLHQLNKYIENSSSEYEAEARLRHKDGRYRWILTRGELERDKDGTPSRMRGCHIDITARKSTEEALRKSQQELRALAAHLQSVREDESARIARELHDQLGQALTALKLDLKWMQARVEEGANANPLFPERLQRSLDVVNETIQSVRRICLELRPSLLDQLGLLTALEWQVRDFEKRTGITCQIEIQDGLTDIPDPAATALFRISQEALTNVAKHSSATAVEYSLQRMGEEVELSICDNGKGLSTDRPGRGFGLLGMRERAVTVGGMLDVKGSTGGGACVVARIPISPSSNEPQHLQECAPVGLAFSAMSTQNGT